MLKKDKKIIKAIECIKKKKSTACTQALCQEKLKLKKSSGGKRTLFLKDTFI